MTRRHHHASVGFGRWNRVALILVGILFVSWAGPAASAFWSSVGSGSAAAKADAVSQGAKPATAVSGTSVTVSWAASTTAAQRPVSGYSIARYGSATGGTRVTATGACGTSVVGLSCVENNVPAGTWYYTVTPLLSLWQGAQSLRSAATTPVTDTTPPLAPVVTAPTYVYQGNVSGVPISGTAEANSTVVLTITGGGAPALTQNITTNPSGGWTAVPVDMTAFSPGTISYSATATDAAGNTGPAGTATSTKDVSSPTVTGVQLSNGGTPNIVDKGDKVVLKFSESLSANSICTAWTDNTTTQTQRGNNADQVVVTISATASDNTLTVSGSACPSLRIGSVSLGAVYTATALSFMGNGANASSLVWDPSANTLTITLGAGTSGSKTVTSANVFPTYTPASGLTDIASNPLATKPVAGAASRF